jgi:hypothetical protein
MKPSVRRTWGNLYMTLKSCAAADVASSAVYCTDPEHYGAAKEQGVWWPRPPATKKP